MRIASIRERTIPLVSELRNAYVEFSTMTASLVAVQSDVVRNGHPVIGYGFSSPGRYAHGEFIRERAVPRLLAADPASLLGPETGELDPVRVHAIMLRGEKPGGHGGFSHAVGDVDLAMWDLAAKLQDVSLASLLAARFGDGAAREDVWVYAAGGYYRPGDSPEVLASELRTYLDAGFDHVKMKIGGLSIDADEERVAAAVSTVGRGDRVAVDANGRFGLEEALEYAHMLDAYDLLWYEEPGDPLDFDLNRRVVEAYGGAVATGENLFSWADVRNLLRYAGMRPEHDYLQMDPALSYGPTEYIRMVRHAEQLGWSRRRFVPHGGHVGNVALAAGLGLGGAECYPGVFAPIGGFADDAVIEGGMLQCADLPGIGVEAKSDLWSELARL